MALSPFARFSRRRALSQLAGLTLAGAFGAPPRSRADARREVRPPPPQQARLVGEFLSTTQTPGIIISAYDRGKRQFYALGQARSDQSEPPTPDTVFGIGSVTKVFTSTLLAARVLERTRAFSLEDRVVDHLPWLQGQPVGDLSQVTLKMLATHTGGLPGHGPDGETLFQDRPPAPELIEWWSKFELPPRKESKLGTKYAYSNVGMITLGYAVAGTEYSKLLARAVTTPLGMRATAAEDFLPKGVPLAQGHVDKHGKTVAIDTLNRDLNASPRDMLRFLEAQLGVLGKAQPVGRAIALSHEVAFRDPDAGFDMGLGWQISHSKPNVYFKAGATSQGGTMCWVGAAPSRRQGIVVQINKQAKGDDYEESRFGDFCRELLGSLMGFTTTK